MSNDDTGSTLNAVIEALEESNRLQQENADGLSRLESLRNSDVRSIQRDRKRARTVRQLVYAVIAGMAVALATIVGLAIVAVQQDDTTARIDCRSTRSALFFDAERHKVEGQVQAWTEQLSGLRQQAVALKLLLTTKDPAVATKQARDYNTGLEISANGLDRAITRSKQYLSDIDAIEGRC